MKRLLFALCILLSITIEAQVDPSLYADMKWRLVGPFRGGRALSAEGVAGQPNVFYFGAVGGGVWKTTDSGHTWQPVFDSQPTASIGALAVSPSNPKVVYVGTGEADMREDITYGDGMYKSIDGGATWTNIGLRDSRQIGRILIDPKDENRVYVAVLGHAYGPNTERGIYRTTDGGKTWQAVLHKDDDTGAIDLAMDPQDSKTIWGSMWQTRRPPWSVYPPSNGPGTGLYKSTDGGDTWTEVKGNGLPSEGLGRIGIAIAPSDRNRMYLVVDAKEGGIFRSDDAGKTWTRGDSSRRVWQRGWYFGTLTVDPKNPDTVYVPNTAMYKSTDGAKSFAAFRGAPGGDDYHLLWIAPEDPQRMIVATDQGTIVSLNGGETWSSWYNQPTGQFYNVSVDNRVPYWLYGSQQDSGAMSVPSRSNFASITERDWTPVPVGDESGMLAPDRVRPNIVYGGTVSKFDVNTFQEQEVSPTTGKDENFRDAWTLPIVISEADPKKIYFSHQMLFRSVNGGESWDAVSPDLTRENPETPANLDAVTAKYGLESPRKGVIFSIGPSPLEANTVWAGTDDGLIHVTRDDGKTWENVTPKELTAWSKVSTIEASHFDKLTAYAAIDRHRLEDNKAYIYRTHDGGKTWQVLGKGIPDGAFVNAVREDPVKKGLLYAGTEMGVYVSFDDGENWQSLKMNLPVVSVREIAFKNDDVIVATHGRAYWILDNVTPLRQAMEVRGDAYLFKPAVSYRIRPGSDMGTPYPAEIPRGENPPSGAAIDYYLKADSSEPVTIEVLDAKGELVRRYSSADQQPKIDEKSLQFQTYWVKPPKPVSTGRGMHRFYWDMRYPSAGAESPQGMGRRGGGPWAIPGQYTVKLSANGQTFTQPLLLKVDPRVRVTEAELQQQFAIARQSAAGSAEIAKAMQRANALSKELEKRRNSAGGQAVADWEKQMTEVVGAAPQGFGLPTTPVDKDRSSLRYLARAFSQLQSAVESADAAPTKEQQQALMTYSARLKDAMKQWERLVGPGLAELNGKLKEAGVEEIILK